MGNGAVSPEQGGELRGWLMSGHSFYAGVLEIPLSVPVVDGSAGSGWRLQPDDRSVVPP